MQLRLVPLAVALVEVAVEVVVVEVMERLVLLVVLRVVAQRGVQQVALAIKLNYLQIFSL